MYAIYILDYIMAQFKLPNGETLEVFVPAVYDLLSSHKDFLAAYRKASHIEDKKTVVVFSHHDENQVPKQMTIAEATAAALKTIKDLGAVVG